MLENKICMIGCVESGYDTITYLLENNIQIDYFVTITKQQAQQSKVSGYKDFSILAKKYNIPIYYPNQYDLKTENDLNFFLNHKFDLVVQGGWQRLIPNNILETFKIGAIGVHGSSNFLPRGRGRSPLNWSLIEGKKRFIMHLFLMKAGADDGDIFDFEQFDINEFDTIKTLYYKNSIVTKKMLVRSIPKLLEGTVTLSKQEGEETYFPKRTSDDGLIQWSAWDVDKIYNFIRALTKPYPGAFSYINNEKISIWSCQIFDRSIKYKTAQYGEVVEVFENGDFIVNCLDGLLLVTKYETNKNIKVGMCLEEMINE